MKIMIISAVLALAPVFAAAQEAARQGAGVLKVTKRHQVVDGDTLWDLSSRYYADPFKWGRIYNANMGLVSNPDLILPQWELVIPGLTDEIRAAAPVIPEQVEEITAPPAEAGDTMPHSVTAAPAAPPAAAPAPAVRPARDTMQNGVPSGSYQKLPDLSEEMPEDQKEWGSFLPTKLAGPDWRADGEIAGLENGDSDDDGLSFTGATVSVMMRSGVMCKAGDYLEAYKIGSTVTRDGKIAGTEIQRVALLEVLSSGGRDLKARVLDANSSVYKGLAVKKK
ncbi:MAG: putative large membrane protein [Elusimicrobia bacterium]|nr:MAG: putative large membrane protein [Elusimicrobiota bacterium]KAF0158179.1 MAG: putative large membrane protein [Elusimicrobiota bacterium]